MNVKTSPQEIQKELENGRNYKSSENLYEIIAQNERMSIGDQWKGMNSQNLPKTTYNFIGQVSNTQVSAVMSQQITINRVADELSKNDEKVNKASKIFTKLDALNWERCKMDALNEDVIMDAFLSGMGASFWYWDEDIITGNSFLTKGDFCGELLDSVNIYVSNPNELDIQKQDWIIISVRKTLQQVREIAKSYGVSQEQLELISSDETAIYEAYDKAQNEQESSKYNSNQTTLNIKLWKENKKVMCCKATSNVMIRKPSSIELERYPIAILNWHKRKRFIYGSSPITSVVPNQKVVNIQAAMRHLHAQLMAIPKVAINKQMVSGFTNTVGGISYVDAPPGTDVASAIRFIQPTQMTIDVDKSIDDGINRTKDLMGANQAALGESNPENFRAIMAQQKAAGVPLESVGRRYKQYVEDVALIWLDFYKNKYKLARKIVLEDENKEEFEETYTGTDMKDIYLQTKIDVGASTQWSELLQIDSNDNLWEKGIIKDPVMYLENMPDNIIPNKQKMIDKFKEEQELAKNTPTKPVDDSAMFEEMLSSMTPEQQQVFMQLPPEEQQALVEEYSQQ